MVENTSNEQHHALIKLINYFLFQKFNVPKHRQDGTYKIGNQLISHLENIVKENEIVDQEAAVAYFENECKEFVLKSKKTERLDLLNSYGLSDIRVFNNTLSFLKPDMIKEFNLKENNDFKDAKIATALIFDKDISGEINLYLRTHFANLLQFIPLSIDRITEQQYVNIIENFGKNFTYEELLRK